MSGGRIVNKRFINSGSRGLHSAPRVSSIMRQTEVSLGKKRNPALGWEPESRRYEKNSQSSTERKREDTLDPPGTVRTARIGRLRRGIIQSVAAASHANDLARQRQVVEGTDAPRGALRISIRGGRCMGHGPKRQRNRAKSVRHRELDPYNQSLSRLPLRAIDDRSSVVSPRQNADMFPRCLCRR